MKIGKWWGLGLSGLLLSGCMSAPPALPAGPAGAAPAALASPPNLWSFLCPNAQQKQECKEKFCNSFLGKMFNSFLAPLSALTGGAIQPCCANASLAQDLKQPPDSAEGAAARIKAEEADAKKRREAVRYLSTVDCARWPEAEEALIKALRGDRNECVRLEAAEGLQHSCCCTRQIMEALLLTVSGGNKDGFPAERSPCVQAAALEALNRCLARCDNNAGTPVPTPERPEKPTPPEKPVGPPPETLPPPAGPPPETLPPPAGPAADSLQYYQRLDRAMDPRFVEDARRLVARATPREGPGRNGVVGLALDAMSNPAAAPAAPAPAQTAEPRLLAAPADATPMPSAERMARITDGIWSIFFPPPPPPEMPAAAPSRP